MDSEARDENQIKIRSCILAHKHQKTNNLSKNRFYSITQAAYIYGFTGHFALFIVFYCLNIKELMWFNCLFSVPIFIIAFVINRLGKHSLAFLFAYTELVTHQVACVYYLGWDCGFHYVFVYIAGLTFFNTYWKRWIRACLLSVVFVSFSFLYLFFKHTPMYVISQTLYDISYLGSGLSTILAIALLVNYYVHTAEDAEKNLLTANKKLDKAYQEVNHQKAELEIRNTFIKKTFGRYLSDSIVESILDTPEGLELGGEKRNVTIMMTDIRGFTRMCEQLPPENVLSILNTYFEIMTEVIMKYNGTIDEFIGDAILVIFGAPFSYEDDTQRAIACALEMQIKMSNVNKINIDKGYPALEMGIGINTGEVIVGNIGSDKRAKYGIVGSNVNLTSRIESYTVGGQILVAESTYNACKSIVKADDILSVKPKGIKEPISIYSITGIYNIHLHKQNNIHMQVLESPIDINFSVINGKKAGTEFYKGCIIKKSEKHLDIQTTASIEKYSNLKVSIDNQKESAIYAKVIALLSDNSPTCVFRVNVTSGQEFLS